MISSTFSSQAQSIPMSQTGTGGRYNTCFMQGPKSQVNQNDTYTVIVTSFNTTSVLTEQWGLLGALQFWWLSMSVIRYDCQ